MKQKGQFLLTLALVLLLKPQQSHSQPDSLRVAFYNCENYFDSFRDSTINDADYTPEGFRRWTYSRFIAKRNALFKVIASMSKPNPPEIIGLCEVENRFVLNKLCYDTPLSKYEYAVVHQNSNDPRGIDVALIYQKSRLHLIDYRYFNPQDRAPKLRTRSILYARFRWGEFDTLHIFVNHFPSKLGGERSDTNRHIVATYLKEKLDSILVSDSCASLAIMGDFNDTPHSSAIELLKSNQIVNLADAPQGNPKGTIWYDKEWETIDQILVSQSLVNGDKPVQLKGRMKIHTSPFLMDTSDSDPSNHRPHRTFQAGKYIGGYSDHLPIYITLYKAL